MHARCLRPAPYRSRRCRRAAHCCPVPRAPPRPQTQPTTYMSRMGVADTEITPNMSSQLDADTDQVL